MVPASRWPLWKFLLERMSVKRSLREASLGKSSEKRPPGVRVAIVVKGPRISAGALGLGSKVSRWLGAPHSQRSRTDLARRGRSFAAVKFGRPLKPSAKGDTNPAFANQRDALIKAAVFEDTPVTQVLDPLGRTVRIEQVDLSAFEPQPVTMTTLSVLNAEGDPVKMADPRFAAGGVPAIWNVTTVYDLSGNGILIENVDSGSRTRGRPRASSYWATTPTTTAVSSWRRRSTASRSSPGGRPKGEAHVCGRQPLARGRNSPSIG